MKLFFRSEKMLFNACEKGDVPKIKKLLREKTFFFLFKSKKIDVNAVNKEGETPLILATPENSVEAVKLLLEHGADVNVVNKKGETPLILATRKNSVEVVKLLLEHGADVNLNDNLKKSPLQHATWHGLSGIAEILIHQGANVNTKDNYNWTPLLRAVSANNLPMIKLFVENGADVNIGNKSGETPLSRAITLPTIKKNSIEIVKLPLQHGADVNFSDNNKKSPLHHATAQGALDVAKILKEHGADDLIDLPSEPMKSQASAPGGHLMGTTGPPSPTALADQLIAFLLTTMDREEQDPIMIELAAATFFAVQNGASWAVKNSCHPSEHDTLIREIRKSFDTKAPLETSVAVAERILTYGNAVELLRIANLEPIEALIQGSTVAFETALDDLGTEDHKVVQLIGIMNEMFVFSFKKAAEIVESYWDSAASDASDLDYEWFTKTSQRGLPQKVSEVDLTGLGLMTYDEWLQSVLKSPRSLVRTRVEIKNLGTYAHRLTEYLKDAFKLSNPKVLDLTDLYLQAGCEICGGGLTGELCLLLGSYKSAGQFVTTDPSLQTLMNGSCPHCHATEYFLIWSGESPDLEDTNKKEKILNNLVTIDVYNEKGNKKPVISSNTKQDNKKQNMKYFESPEPDGDGQCSDNNCPCGTTYLSYGKGYMYVSKEAVEFRKDARSVNEAYKKMENMPMDGSLIAMDKEKIDGILMCEQGARLRKLDLDIASNDAKYWWKTGLVPLRPTPIKN